MRITFVYKKQLCLVRKVNVTDAAVARRVSPAVRHMVDPHREAAQFLSLVNTMLFCCILCIFLTWFAKQFREM